MSIEYERIDARDLTEEHFAAWEAMQQGNSRFGSPFFHPEFTRAVASVRAGGAVVILRRAGRPVGFFPFESSRGVAVPIGGRLNDFQGVIVAENVMWSPSKLLQATACRAWNFDHLLAEQTELRPFHSVVADSPYLHLTEGFDAYVRRCSKSGEREIRQTWRKLRRVVQEHGPLRLERHTKNDDVWRQLRIWKGMQYQQTGMLNILEVPWVAAVLERIRTIQTPGFGGVLSALYAGDNLLAAHLGMRSGPVTHWWFPAYNREFARYSPGSLLLLQTAHSAPELGIGRIDLGRGPEPFKRLWGSDVTLVAEGQWGEAGMATALNSHWLKARHWLRHSPVYDALRTPLRWVRPFRSWLAFR